MRIGIRIAIGILASAVLALVAGWGYQRGAQRRDAERFPPPGELHSVQGRLMHIHCRGEGSPTIVVEQGIGGPAIDWNPINEQMSRITRVCDYDRAGMGYSEPAYVPTRSADVARNLHSLLAAAKVDDDLILVGWSAGGMYAREFHRQFPRRVKGMVLVDSAHEQGVQRMPPQPANREHLRRLMRKYWLAQFGWLRLNGEVEGMFADAPVSVEDRRRLVAIFQKSHTYRTLVDEGVGLEQDLAQGLAPPDLGDMPLVVIAEGAPRHPYLKENLALLHELQRELARLSTDARFVVAEHSAHFIHRTEPGLILDAAAAVVGSVRSGQPLTSR